MAMKSSPHSLQVEKACTQQQRPSVTKVNTFFLKIKEKEDPRESSLPLLSAM